MITTEALRDLFLEYFSTQGHTRVSSSSLIPGSDPTLLFTNSGMVQFKDVFLGREKRPYKRAASAQRCLRAGGKHNDLENVGYTARHHTFFEMLGNFSFGDYFKREAIRLAWAFLTEKLKLPPERLWVTVFHEDEEAFDIWVNDIQFDPKRISRCGEKDNFWMMGDTGPCGPCSEIFYDHGPEIPGGPPGSPEADGDRYIEIWNMVFMQYERFADGRQVLLPKPSVDTGMGLERIAAVLQGVHDNYDIDLFQSLISSIAQLGKLQDLKHQSLRVIADHIRACSFLVVDGVLPSNEGRGYVLRRILRRAIRHGHQLGFQEPFFYKLVQPLAALMGKSYPELWERAELIKEVLYREELQFSVTLQQGMKIFDQAVSRLAGPTLPGEIIFKLYDTYGFPVDLTADVARERGISLDLAGFETAMEAQRKQSQQATQFDLDYTKQLKSDEITHFTGYDTLQAEAATVTALFQGEAAVSLLSEKKEGIIVLNHTPFYAEGGGQVGDRGLLRTALAEFQVSHTTKVGQAYLHHGTVSKGQFRLGDPVFAEVNQESRLATQAHHSATHLLHAALRQVLGSHVQQKGSLVEPERLRFDFSHSAPLTAEQIEAIENLVNQAIQSDLPVSATLMPADEAKKTGALALFGEKYGDEVRVLSMGNFSRELCGGTHVKATGQIGAFFISEESGIASGIRRIEAIAGMPAVRFLQEQRAHQQALRSLLNTVNPIEQRQLIQRLQADHQALKNQFSQLELTAYADKLKTKVQSKQGFYLLMEECQLASAQLRPLVDRLKQTLDSAVIILGVKEAGKASVVVGVTENLVSQFQANSLIKILSEKLEGRGGGKPDFAQAGSSKPEKLAEAFQTVSRVFL